MLKAITGKQLVEDYGPRQKRGELVMSMLEVVTNGNYELTYFLKQPAINLEAPVEDEPVLPDIPDEINGRGAERKDAQVGEESCRTPCGETSPVFTPTEVAGSNPAAPTITPQTTPPEAPEKQQAITTAAIETPEQVMLECPICTTKFPEHDVCPNCNRFAKIAEAAKRNRAEYARMMQARRVDDNQPF